MQPFSFENLPMDWKWTPIGEIADAVRGVAFPGDETSKENFENSIACLTTSGVQDEVNWKSRRFIPKGFLSNEKQILKDGDLLVSTANSKELVGKSCLIKKPIFPCTFGAFVTVLRPNTKIDSSLFAYWMRSNEVLRWCFQNSSNTTNISNLRTTELLALEIPIPKPDEQKRIAAILDKADRLRRQRRFAQTLSDSFLQSVFIKMFGDSKTNPFNWEELPFEEVCSIDAKLVDPKNKIYQKLFHIGGDNIESISGELKKLKTIEEEKPISSKFLVTAKHILFSKIRPKLRKVSFPKINALCSADIYPISVRSNANPLFVIHYLRGEHFSTIVSNLAETRTNIPKVNRDELAELRFPLPPLPLQEKFAEIVQKFERVRRQQREATRQAEHLFQTLLHRAFRGEL